MNMLESLVDRLSQKGAAGRAFDDALEKGDTQFCLAMIEQKPEVAKRIDRDMFGQDTFLMAAIRHGNAEVVEKLLQKGARLNIPLKYAGDHETPLTAVMRSNYRHTAVVDVVLDHYVEQKENRTPSVLDQVKERAASLFTSIGKKLDSLIQHPGIALAGISTVPAALGSAIGATAAGVAVAPAAPALAAAAAVGVGAAVISNLRSGRMPDALAARHIDAEDYLAQLAANHTPRRDHSAGDQSPVNVRAEAASKVLAEDYIQSNSLEGKSANQETGRYAGPLIYQTAHHIVQDTGRGSTVIHAKTALDMRSIEAAVQLAKSTRIQYSNGRAVIDAGIGQGHSNSRSR
jgi:hypothetical protein